MKVLILLVAIAVVVASFEFEDFVGNEGEMIAKRAFEELMEVSKRARSDKGKPYSCINDYGQDCACTKGRGGKEKFLVCS